MHARNSGGDIQYEPAPVGMHIARCIRVVDLGTRLDDYWGKEKHECWIMWELPNEIHTYSFKDENGNEKTVSEPFTVSRFYTLSLSDKAHLRDHLESWRSKAFTEEELDGFHMKKVLGAPCMVNVIHQEKKRGKGINAVVKSVTGLPKDLQCPEAHHDLLYFSLEEFNPEDLEKLSKGIKARVMESNEYKEMVGQRPKREAETEVNPPPADMEFDDIPF